MGIQDEGGASWESAPMRLRLLNNPPSPYVTDYAEWLEPPPAARVEVYEETAKSILSRNDSPDIPFTWSINPYRGCQHACAYCYARRTHEYLGLGAGTDFDTKLVAKINAPRLLRRALSKPSWKRGTICFSGVTDCYQPLEAVYRLTRRCLEVCAEFHTPVGVVTKGFLVVRDIDVLREIHARAEARVFVSVPFADAETSGLIEPQAPPPARRIEAIRRLAQAGIPTGVMVAPIIPGLNDADVPAILEQAAQAGARWASYTALRLPGNVLPVFVERLRERFPLRAKRVLARLRASKGGRLNVSEFGDRMQAQGAYWKSVQHLFALHVRRLGLNRHDRASSDADSSSDPLKPMAPPPRSHPAPRAAGIETNPTPAMTQLTFDFEKT